MADRAGREPSLIAALSDAASRVVWWCALAAGLASLVVAMAVLVVGTAAVLSDRVERLRPLAAPSGCAAHAGEAGHG